jgi:Tfp pilus assembly pilus retraction ATPase PilT
MLLKLQKQTTKIKCSTTLTSLSQSAQNQLQLTMCIFQTMRKKVIQLHIRKSLAFAEIAERYDAIGKSHDNTFIWSFAKKDSPEMTPERIDVRKKCAEWLSPANGMFHIAGKPGSGKSTLMISLERTKHYSRTIAMGW